MKDEIKEILEYMKQYVKEPNAPDYNGEYPQPWEITIEEVQCILDCITNLQQTNKNHSKKIIEMGNKITNLQEENEMYKKELEKADSITQSCIFEGSRSAGKSYRQCLNYLEDYKSRIEKAIECLANCNWNDKNIIEIYDILNNGEDNE